MARMRSTVQSIKTVKKLKGARVLVRVDFNVPLDSRGNIAEKGEARLRGSLETIEYLRRKGARVVLISHFGRPEGREKKYSLAKVARRLTRLLETPALFASDPINEDSRLERRLGRLRDGDVALLENLRFYPGEEKNSDFFSRRLAGLADIFVNDAFSVCHRSHASTVGVTRLLPSYAGIRLALELENLTRLMGKPKRPFVALVGGAKISTKLPALTALLKTADAVLVGGAMANSFFAAKGYQVGRSAFSHGDVRLAKKLLTKKNLILPSDALVSARIDGSASARVVAPNQVGRRDYIVDVGTATMREYAARIKKAKTLAWNGPVGMCEVRRFSHGSMVLGRAIASRSSGPAFGVVGGGETVACLEETGMAEYVDHVSLGGGAMLDFIGGKKLPGLEALRQKG